MPPGMLVVRIDGPTSPVSFSMRLVSRQVRSKPPPGAAGAMHSGFCGWKSCAWTVAESSSAQQVAIVVLMAFLRKSCCSHLSVAGGRRSPGS